MDERIYIIIAKELAGEADIADLQQLDAWLSSGEQNRDEYERIKTSWLQADEVIERPVFNTASAWEKVSGRIQQDNSKKVRTISIQVWAKYAAGIAAILIISILIWKPFSQNSTEVILADNGNKEVVLPDNSHITLREGSRLEYPARFDDRQRNVTLEGEAFFEVARNEKQPFVIDAGAVHVKVLGTSFNVRCSEDDAEVTVATGKVQMTAVKKTTGSVILTPGEKGVLSHNQLAETVANDNNYLYWKTGVLVFENKSLQYITTELSRIQKTEITLDKAMPDSLKLQAITIRFDRQPVEEMLTELCLVAKCRWVRNESGYIISAK